MYFKYAFLINPPHCYEQMIHRKILSIIVQVEVRANLRRCHCLCQKSELKIDSLGQGSMSFLRYKLDILLRNKMYILSVRKSEIDFLYAAVITELGMN